MQIQRINPYVRAAQIQPAVLEGRGERKAYDHRLFYLLEGDGEFVLEGTPYAVRPDTLIFIPPAVGYRFRGKMKVAVLNFDMSRQADIKTEPICPPPEEEFSPELLFDSARAEGFEYAFLLVGNDFLREGTLSLVRVWNERGEWSDTASSAALKTLLAEILQWKTPKKDPEQLLCERVQGYLRLHAVDVRDNGALGERFGYHPVYLGEVFRRKTGKTLHEAILSERLALAKRWLLQTDTPVEEIALDTGFSSRSHFCTVFRKETGTTPLRYRREALRKREPTESSEK